MILPTKEALEIWSPYVSICRGIFLLNNRPSFLVLWEHICCRNALTRCYQSSKDNDFKWEILGTRLISLRCYCTHEQKMNFEGFTQNGCYGNEPQPFEVLFYSIDANTSCSFTKQDLTVKQAHRANFCFVLGFEPKFWQLTLVSSAFYRLFSKITSFYTTPIGQIIPCHVTDNK